MKKIRMTAQSSLHRPQILPSGNSTFGKSLAISRKLKDGLNLQDYFDQIIILQII